LATREVKVIATKERASNKRRLKPASGRGRFKASGAAMAESLQNKLDQINEGLDTTEALWKWTRSKPSLERQITLLEDRHGQNQKALS